MSRVYEFISRWRWEKRLEVSVAVGHKSGKLNAREQYKANWIKIEDGRRFLGQNT